MDKKPSQENLVAEGIELVSCIEKDIDLVDYIEFVVPLNVSKSIHLFFDHRIGIIKRLPWLIILNWDKIKVTLPDLICLTELRKIAVNFIVVAYSFDWHLVYLLEKV